LDEEKKVFTSKASGKEEDVNPYYSFDLQSEFDGSGLGTFDPGKKSFIMFLIHLARKYFLDKTILR